MLGGDTLWNFRVFRSDKATSNLLLDGNVGRLGPNFNVLHTVHLSKRSVLCDRCNFELNSNSKVIQ